MKIICLEIINENSSVKGIPCELLLFLGKISKSNENTVINLNISNDKLKIIFLNKITTFLQFYKIKNILISNDLNSAFKERISNETNLYFSSKVNENNIKTQNLEKFIDEYEKLFGTLPFYTEDDKLIEKFIFINDVILQFSQDIILH